MLLLSSIKLTGFLIYCTILSLVFIIVLLLSFASQKFVKVDEHIFSHEDFTKENPNLRAIVLNREGGPGPDDHTPTRSSTPSKEGESSKSSGVKIRRHFSVKKPHSSGGDSGGPQKKPRRLSPEKSSLDHTHWIPKVCFFPNYCCIFFLCIGNHGLICCL